MDDGRLTLFPPRWRILIVMAVTLVYFVYLAALAGVRRRLTPLIVSLVTLACVVLVGMAHVMPLIYLLVGYRLPALLVRTHNLSFERGLVRLDRRVFGPDGLERFNRDAPRVVLEYLELAYLLCYATVPIGFAWLALAGGEDVSGMFWSTVLLASFSCYGLLPWLATRAPRAGEPAFPRRPSVIRNVNLRVLGLASVQWNTFPSGHTAASLATALAVGSVSPEVGTGLGVLAISIAIGSVVGRYHYAADAVAGALMAIGAFAMASAAHAP